MVAVDIPVSEIEDLLHASTPLGSHLHVFVVDRLDQTVLAHPFLFKHCAFPVSQSVCYIASSACKN